MDDDPHDENENSCEVEAEPAVDSEAGSKAESFVERKKLQLSSEKCSRIHIGRKQKEIPELNGEIQTERKTDG